MQLSQVDMNLLTTLDVLLQERSVSRAARRLHRTPSAISHALSRLRVLFGDELLVRDGQRMRPTARAVMLAETLPLALEHLTRAISDPEPFAASTSTRTFKLAVPDFAARLLPALLGSLAAEAPGVRIEIRSRSPHGLRDLAEGRIDALIGPSALKDNRVRGVPLGSWAWRVYARAGHRALHPLSLASWAVYPHLMVRTSTGSGMGPIERIAARMGIERSVQATVPQFSMAAPVLAHTELLFTAPSIAMESAAEAYGLESGRAPFDIPEMGLSLFRSATNASEPGVCWLVERVTAVARRLTEPGAH